MNAALKKRLEALERRITPKRAYCIVELPDGTERETTLVEWYAHRNEWKWKRITRGGNVDDICLLFAALDDEVAADAMQKGDTAGAARMTAESARWLAEYERGRR